jgi:hypothetical protein
VIFEEKKFSFIFISKLPLSLDLDPNLAEKPGAEQVVANPKHCFDFGRQFTLAMDSMGLNRAHCQPHSFHSHIIILPRYCHNMSATTLIQHFLPTPPCTPSCQMSSFFFFLTFSSSRTYILLSTPPLPVHRFYIYVNIHAHAHPPRTHAHPPRTHIS